MKRKKKPFKIRDTLEQKLGKSKLKKWVYPDRTVSVLKDQKLVDVYQKAEQKLTQELVQLQQQAKESQQTVSQTNSLKLVNMDVTNLQTPQTPQMVSGAVMRKVKHRLTQSGFYQLCEYIKTRKTDIEKNKPAYDRVTKEAGIALNMNLSVDQIQRAARVIGIKDWVHRKSNGITMLNMIRNVTMAIHELYTRLNDKPPEYLTEQLNRLRPQFRNTESTENAS